MLYTVSYKEPHKRFIDIELSVEQINSDTIEFQLPAWRPGRYELQNFGRNIQKFNVTDKEGQELPFEKTTKERWLVKTKGLSALKVNYNCYAYQMDAGGCWLDEEQLYLNFIYCMIYVAGREKESCQVDLKIPAGYQIACGLLQKGNSLFAKNFYQLADSPMIASASLKHKTYEAGGVNFHIWIHGEAEIPWETILNHFKNFSSSR